MVFVSGPHPMLIVYGPSAVGANPFVSTTTQVDLSAGGGSSIASFSQYLVQSSIKAQLSTPSVTAYELPPGITVSDVRRACDECTQNRLSIGQQ